MIESRPDSSVRWTRTHGDRTIHSDSDEHVHLVVRTLGIDEAAWAGTLDRYAQIVDPDAGVPHRLQALRDAFRPASVHAAPLPNLARSVCTGCGALAMTPIVARNAGPGKPTLVYGRCTVCGHGSLLAGASQPTIYEGDAYYRRREPDGTGYEAYASEQSYREAKGARLLDRLAEVFGTLPSAPSLLEVGSGFGFTRRAAELHGFRTAGVDLNPFAVQTAKKLYGFETIIGTLGEAIDQGTVEKAAWDLVLYQFVLEHVPNPALELRRAAEAVAPGGCVVFVSPNMGTFELDVFGASYRSLRADHFHLFSVASARAYAEEAQLTEVAHETTCSLHLLRGFLTQSELDDLYAHDGGPDLLFMARRSS